MESLLVPIEVGLWIFVFIGAIWALGKLSNK